MKKWDFRKTWQAFLHWDGWRAFACFWVRAWKHTVSWSGWRRFFLLPSPAVLALCALCAAGLFIVFHRGLEQSLPGFLLYPLSFYALVTLALKLPDALRSIKRWLSRHPRTAAVLRNRELRFKATLYFEQFVNFAYGAFKIVSGIVYGSAWIGADGIYNMAQALIQLFLILRRKRIGTLERQWRTYRLCGALILLMHLTLTGIVFQTIHLNRADEQGEILVITTAFFAFFKFAKSFMRIAKDRKHLHPVDSSIRMLNLAQAIFAIFSLQASMFHTFGTGESWEQLLNIITGSAACLLIMSVGVYMLRRGRREIKQLQEVSYGESSLF